jgi:hypothetical protein
MAGCEAYVHPERGSVSWSRPAGLGAAEALKIAGDAESSDHLGIGNVSKEA